MLPGQSPPPLPDGFEIFWATPTLAVGAMPCKPEHLTLLKEQGLGAVLNLCAEFCDLPDIERQYGLAVRYLPINDMDVPDSSALDEALDWLDARMADGGKAFIHCRFGMGRTGVVLACFMARRGLCVSGASSWRARPASPAQHRFVMEYLRAKGLAPADESLWDKFKACLFGR